MKSIEELLGIPASGKLEDIVIPTTTKVVQEEQLAADLKEQAKDLSAFYQVESTEIIAACKADLNYLAPVAMPDVFEHPFPPVLLLVWQMVTNELQNRTTRFPKIALGIPRGHAKTTIVKLLILYIILFTDRQYILVLASIEKKAIAIISDVIAMLKEDNIVRIFGKHDITMEMDQQALKKFYFRGRWIVIHGTGALGDVRGTNLGNERPDVIVFEDVQSREAAQSEVQSKAIEGWMYSTVMKAKSPKGCIYLFVGNMYPTPHSILRKLKKNPLWIKFISGAIRSNGEALWPEVHPVSALLEELEHDVAAGCPESFLAEVQNETDEAVFNRTINLSKFVCRDVTEPDYIVRARFTVIDPATGKRGEGLDNVGIGYFETTADAPKRPIARKMTLAPLTPLQAILVALKYCIDNNCRVIGVESNAYQSTYLFWFDYVCRQMGISGYHFVELYSHNSKPARVTAVLKAFVGHEIETTIDTHADITSQAVGYDFTKTKNEDEALDLCSFAIAMTLNNQALLEALDPAGLLLEAATSNGVMSMEDSCGF